jgi:hypothetical protein
MARYIAATPIGKKREALYAEALYANARKEVRISSNMLRYIRCTTLPGYPSTCANGWCWRTSWCSIFACRTGGEICVHIPGTLSARLAERSASQTRCKGQHAGLEAAV